MPSECPECGLSCPDGAKYCALCGCSLSAKPIPTRGFAFSDTAALVATGIAAVLMSFALGYIVFHFPDIQRSLTAEGIVLFAACMAVFLFCAGYAIKRVAEITGSEPEKLPQSGAVGAGKWLAVLLAVSYAYAFITMAAGSGIDSSELEKFTNAQLSALLFIAGPREEILYRVLPIGIPMAAMFLICRRKGALSCVMGGFGTSRVAWILIAVSAVLFGFAHLDGWNAAKVPQAIISGLIFGYLFAEYGLYVSVLVHTCLDCTAVAAFVIPLGSSLCILALCIIGLILIAGFVVSPNKKPKTSAGWLGAPAPDSVWDRWKRHR